MSDTDEGIRRLQVPKMVQYVREFTGHPDITRLARRITQLCEAKDKLCEMKALFYWTKNHMRYVSDPVGKETIATPVMHLSEIMTPPSIVRAILGDKLLEQMRGFGAGHSLVGDDGRKSILVCRGCFVDELSGLRHSRTSGDCVPFSQKVVVRDRSNLKYRVIPIGELERSWDGYDVVSYNETDGKFEFKPITRFIDKGVLPVYRIKLSNGTEFRCTENHELYVFERRGQKEEWTLVTMTLRQLMDLRTSKGIHHRLAIPVAKRIPEAGFDGSVSDDQLWIEGLYAAEGWSEISGGVLGRGRRPVQGQTSFRSKIGMNNPEVITELEEKLDAIGQVHGKHVRHDGLATVRISPSEFTRHLAREFGQDSGSKRFPDGYESLSRRQIEVLLSAYIIGDGYVPRTGQWAKYANVVYNTKSETLARQIAFMHLVIGRPISFYRQPAWKTKPVMYRLYEYKGAAEEKAPDLVSTRIVSIEKDEPERCCDITVADNHNFILEGGVLVHNCDEGATFLATLLASVGIVPRFRFGGYEDPSASDGCNYHHVWVQGLDDSGNWVDMDVTEKKSDLGWFYDGFGCTGIAEIFHGYT
jgi:intein/homing endonuclease